MPGDVCQIDRREHRGAVRCICFRGNICDVESGDRFAGEAPRNGAPQIILEPPLVRGIEPRHVETAADVFLPAEAEILRPREEDVVHEHAHDLSGYFLSPVTT